MTLLEQILIFSCCTWWDPQKKFCYTSAPSTFFLHSAICQLLDCIITYCVLFDIRTGHFL